MDWDASRGDAAATCSSLVLKQLWDPGPIGWQGFPLLSSPIKEPFGMGCEEELVGRGIPGLAVREGSPPCPPLRPCLLQSCLSSKAVSRLSSLLRHGGALNSNQAHRGQQAGPSPYGPQHPPCGITSGQTARAAARPPSHRLSCKPAATLIVGSAPWGRSASLRDHGEGENKRGGSWDGICPFLEGWPRSQRSSQHRWKC